METVPKQARRSASLRLLLSHKSARVRAALAESFRTHRIAVCVTAPGEAFALAARRFRPDLVVTDDVEGAFGTEDMPQVATSTHCSVTWLHPDALERVALGAAPAETILSLLQPMSADTAHG
jgi:uncharacterized Rossmann fold enzyme